MFLADARKKSQLNMQARKDLIEDGDCLEVEAWDTEDTHESYFRK
jgi:hypothetical protein